MFTPDQSLASIQRQRTHLLYAQMAKSQAQVNIQLVNQANLTAAKFLGIDSAESKLLVHHLNTDWGTTSTGVTLRTQDIAWISVDIYNS